MQDYFYFLNRKNVANGFRESLNSRFFVDKSMLIQTISEKILTKEKWVCLSRPRRFGKTMAVEMLAAYYTCLLYTSRGQHVEVFATSWIEIKVSPIIETLVLVEVFATSWIEIL